MSNPENLKKFQLEPDCFAGPEKPSMATMMANYVNGIICGVRSIASLSTGLVMETANGRKRNFEFYPSGRVESYREIYQNGNELFAIFDVAGNVLEVAVVKAGRTQRMYGDALTKPASPFVS